MGEEKIEHIWAGRHSIIDIIEQSDGGNFTIRESERPERSVTLSRSMIPVLISIIRPLAK
jgi:hypothetical protein